MVSSIVVITYAIKRNEIRMFSTQGLFCLFVCLFCFVWFFFWFFFVFCYFILFCFFSYLLIFLNIFASQTLTFYYFYHTDLCLWIQISFSIPVL